MPWSRCLTLSSGGNRFLRSEVRNLVPLVDKSDTYGIVDVTARLPRCSTNEQIGIRTIALLTSFVVYDYLQVPTVSFV